MKLYIQIAIFDTVICYKIAKIYIHITFKMLTPKIYDEDRSCNYPKKLHTIKAGWLRLLS